MKTIFVDDEPEAISEFTAQVKDIERFELIGTFQQPLQAEEFVRHETVDLAILDINMSGISGLELARRLRTLRPGILIVFLSVHHECLREANELDVDYFLVKPCTRPLLERLARRMDRLMQSRKKNIYIQMFGRFVVFKYGRPLPLTGKAKEILALVASREGKEISNEEIYSTIWEDREISNEKMKVYYNALKRLKTALEKEHARDLLISTRRGQMLNKNIADCDYYAWLAGAGSKEERFIGEFLTEYPWAEFILTGLYSRQRNL